MIKPKNTAPNAAPLSPMLSRIRHRVARSKLPNGFQPSAMLDIGCGVYPKFMIESKPEWAVGMDRKPKPEGFPADIEYVQQDFSMTPQLDFEDESFDLISALAVLEHIEPEPLGQLLAEVRRVLKVEGYFVATMPSGIGDVILHMLSRIGLTSRTNLQEHQDRYTCRKVKAIMLEAGFQEEELDIGRFEMGMNIYIRARKM